MNQQNQQIVSPYLLRKIVQPNSLRSFGAITDDGEEYLGKNLVLYLNRKVKHQRFKQKGNLNNQISEKQQKRNQKNQAYFKLDVDDIKVDIKDQDFKKMDNQLLSILEYYTYKDDCDRDRGQYFNEVIYRNNFDLKKEFPEKLKQLLKDNLNNNRKKQIYELYKREKLKDKINLLGAKSKDYDFIKKKLVAQNETIESDQDYKQEEYLLNIITKQQNLNVGNILSLQDKNIQYKKQNYEQEQFNEERKQGKMTSMEMVNELIDDQYIQENNNIVKMYQEAKLENYDPSGSTKNKFKMLAYKKKNEKQQELEEVFLKNEKKQLVNVLRDPEQEPRRFVREKKKVYSGPKQQMYVFNRLTQSKKVLSNQFENSQYNSPKFENKSHYTSHYGRSTDRGSLSTQEQSGTQTSRYYPYGTSQKKQNIHVKESVLKETNFLRRANSDFLESFYDKKQIPQQIAKHQQLGQKSEAKRLFNILQNEEKRQKLKQLKQYFPQFQSNNEEMVQMDINLKLMDDVINSGIEDMQKNQEIITQKMALSDPRFIAFKKEQIFIKGLINFMIDKVENKSGVVSKFVDKQWQEQFAKKIMGQNDD